MISQLWWKRLNFGSIQNVFMAEKIVEGIVNHQYLSPKMMHNNCRVVFNVKPLLNFHDNSTNRKRFLLKCTKHIESARRKNYMRDEGTDSNDATESVRLIAFL